MRKFLTEKNIKLAFEISVVLKGLHALMELIGGAIILFISKEFVITTIFAITQEELSEDPKDFIAHYLTKLAQNFSVSAQQFAALYLLSHGLIKIFLVIGLLKEKLWAYPAAIVIFSTFIIYQLWRFAFTHSIWLLLLTIFDIIIIWLTWHEYRYKKSSTNAF